MVAAKASRLDILPITNSRALWSTLLCMAWMASAWVVAAWMAAAFARTFAETSAASVATLSSNMLLAWAKTELPTDEGAGPIADAPSVL